MRKPDTDREAARIAANQVPNVLCGRRQFGGAIFLCPEMRRPSHQFRRTMGNTEIVHSVRNPKSSAATEKAILMTTNPHTLHTTTGRERSGSGRVWLVAPLCTTAAPTDRPPVRDDLMRTWLPDGDATYRSPDGRRKTTWAQLHAQFDLVEVTS